MLLLLAANNAGPPSFSQAGISDVRVERDGPELHVAWGSPAPWGAVFQVYINRRLAWSGRSRSCRVPVPADSAGRNVWVEVGTVRPLDARRDFSAALRGPGGSGDRARLTWIGGTYLDPSGSDDVRGFKVYGSATAGGPVDFSRPLTTVAAYPGGAIADGFGGGGFGQGGFGRSASSYEWRSGPLSSGDWGFAIVPYDGAGNVRSAPATVTVAIAAAPRPPAPDAGGNRLSYSYAGPTTRLATLSWLASP